MTRQVFTAWNNEIRIADPVFKADTFMSRFRGLMLRKALAEGEGLLLENCPAIHCCFMRFTIDVIYLDDDFNVIGKETVKPWRIGGHFKGAKHVLEIAEGAGRQITAGTRLKLEEKHE